MLKSVSIKNFLVIDDLKLDFNSGLTVISGESGAGKSTVIDAICWCLGIENKPTKDIFNAIVGIEFHEHKIIRTNNAKGKSSFFLDGKKVSKKNLLCTDLITICTQDSRLAFSLEDNFRKIIDSMLDDSETLPELKNKFLNWKIIQDEITALETLYSEDLDYIQSVLDEIDSLELKGNDEERLVTERREQLDLYKSYESLQKAMKVFDEGDIVS